MSHLKIDVFLSAKNQRAHVTHALETILASIHPHVTCHMIDGGSTDGTVARLAPFAERCHIHTCKDSEHALATLNQVMRETNGDLMMWLDAGDRVSLWGLASATAVFRRSTEVQWLTSGVPLVWTQSQFIVAGAVSDGFSRETFLRGRNLRTSPAFRQAIPRAVTLWRRALWEQCGCNVRAPLERAGDFDLWARFWEHAELFTLPLPLGGRDARAPEPDATYWRAAEEILQEQLPSTSPRSVLHGRQSPGSPARLVRLRARSDECAFETRYIV